MHGETLQNPTSILGGYEDRSSLLRVQPTVVFGCKNVDSATSTQKTWISSLCLNLHTPLSCVGPRIFLSNKPTILIAFWERVHVCLLHKTMLLMRVLYSNSRNLHLVSRHFITSISCPNSTPYFL